MALNQAFSYSVLFAVFALTLWAGCVLKPERIIPALILASPLLLPPYRTVDFPGWELERVSAVTMPALLLLPLVARQRWRDLHLGIPDLFLGLFVVWSVLACTTNQGSHAGVFRAVFLLTNIVVPFLYGRLCLCSDDDLRGTVKVLWWLPVLYFAIAVIESVRAPTFAPILYGESGPQMPRGFLFRPPGFMRHSLEMGNHIAVLALLLAASLRAGLLGEDRTLRTKVALGCAAAIGTVLVTLSRGPICALLLAVAVPLVFRRMALLGTALAAAGVGIFFWMMLKGSGTELGAQLASGGSQLDQNLLYRFRQIDMFKGLMSGHELLGWGESWPRIGPIKIIDGQLLIQTLSTGYVGAALLALHWTSTCFSVARKTESRTSAWHWVGAGFAGMLGFLTFSSWGDSFIRSPHFLLIGAVPAALVRMRRQAPAEAGLEVREARWRYG